MPNGCCATHADSANHDADCPSHWPCGCRKVVVRGHTRPHVHRYSSPARGGGRLLVPERGLTDTRRNRQWLGLVELLGDEVGGGQEENEKLAWRIINLMETTG